mgnify:FL=1
MNKAAAFLTLSISPLLVLGGCGDDSSPRWIDGGTHVALVSELSLPDTIMASDSLRITLSATLLQPTGRPTFAVLETQRSTHRLEATVWADVDLWAGAGPMPPTDLTVLEGYTHVEPPPFALGPFEVVLTQPDGTARADTVHVAGG